MNPNKKIDAQSDANVIRVVGAVMLGIASLSPTYMIMKGVNKCAIGGRVWRGGTYFFTVNLAERKRTLLVDYVNTLRNVIRTVKARRLG